MSEWAVPIATLVVVLATFVYSVIGRRSVRDLRANDLHAMIQRITDIDRRLRDIEVMLREHIQWHLGQHE